MHIVIGTLFTGAANLLFAVIVPSAPYWAFGFQLCRWGYKNIEETREQVQRMREAGIPLEVMWNDIDLYHAYRDFTSDTVSFPGEEMRSFIRELVRALGVGDVGTWES